MIISIIAALSLNRVIGNRNMIPWNLPSDLEWFKFNTIKKPVIMGRKTFESIGRKPLSKRINIVISNYLNNIPGIIFVRTPIQALFIAEQFTTGEVMILGGSKLYEYFINKAKKLYLTHVYTNINGDTLFPDYIYDKSWISIFNQFHKSDNINFYNYRFEILKRI